MKALKANERFPGLASHCDYFLAVKLELPPLFSNSCVIHDNKSVATR